MRGLLESGDNRMLRLTRLLAICATLPLCFQLGAQDALAQNGVRSTSSNSANDVNAKTVSTASSSASSSGVSANIPLRPAPQLAPAQAFPQAPTSNLNQLSSQGIYSESQGHKHGVVVRALGGAAADVGHATLGFVSAMVSNQGIDLPPDDASSPEWPFNEPHRKAMYYITWADGSTAKISRLPDGSLQILGSGKRYVMQPEGEGSYAMFGDFGTMASMTPRPGGGFTIVKADGTTEQVIPRDGGGFVVENKNGIVATILPGVNGSRHIRGSGYSSGFMQ